MNNISSDAKRKSNSLNIQRVSLSNTNIDKQLSMLPMDNNNINNDKLKINKNYAQAIQIDYKH